MTNGSNATAASNTAALSFTRIFPSNVTAGRLLIAAVRYSTAANNLDSVTDTLGNTWSILGEYAATDARTGFLAWCVTTSSGATTVTFNHPVSEAGHTAVAEFILDGTGTLDLNDLLGASTANAGSGTTGTSNARTPTAANGGGISLAITSGNVTTAPATGETNVTNVASTRLNILFEQFTSAVAQTHSATWTTIAWTMPLVLFADTAVATTTFRRPLSRPFPFRPGGRRDGN